MENKAVSKTKGTLDDLRIRALCLAKEGDLVKLASGETAKAADQRQGFGGPVEVRFPPEPESLLASTMRRYGLTEQQAQLSLDRREIYGDPEINHRGIGLSIVGLLQPWVTCIAQMNPLPAHVVANVMAAMKLNRQRMRFHKDNYDDLAVYQAFARVWQEEYESNPANPKPETIGPPPSPRHVLKLVWVDTANE